MSLTREAIEAKFKNIFGFYLPFEVYLYNKWRTAIICKDYYVIYCNPLNETKFRRGANIGRIAHESDFFVKENWLDLAVKATVFAELRTNIKLSLWDWKTILHAGINRVTNYYYDLIIHLPIPFNELLITFNSFYVPSIMANIISRMIDLNIKIDIKSLPISIDRSLSIYIPDAELNDNIFYNCPTYSCYLYDLSTLLERTLEVQEYFNNSSKKLALYRLIEFGFLTSDIKNTTHYSEELDLLVDEAVEKLKAINYQVRKSLIFLPKDLRGIIYGYIAWWKNVGICNSYRDLQ